MWMAVAMLLPNMLPENSLTDSRLNEDIHELNTEIVRLAYFLNIDIEDAAVLDQFLSTNLPDDHEHFHKLATLKGLILLRGHIHELRAEHGVPDGCSPLQEHVYEQLNHGHHPVKEI
jgi:hypothetical protein